LGAKKSKNTHNRTLSKVRLREPSLACNTNEQRPDLG
jgi:hypothetical protein